MPQFVGFIVFFVAGFAETNRPPFDLPEADAELVQGYITEYGGGRFAAFYAAEYLNIIVVSAITTTLFLGGWNIPFGSTRRPGSTRSWCSSRPCPRLHVHLGARHAAAAALRPADVARVEDLPPAARAVNALVVTAILVVVDLARCLPASY